jgi:hypothetical protein
MSHLAAADALKVSNERLGPIASVRSTSTALLSWRAPSSSLSGPEHAGVARLRRRHERLLADGDEVALRPLHAERAVPATPRLVYQLHARLGGVVVEYRADLRALELGMGVSGPRDLGSQCLQNAQFVEAAAQLGAALVHHDAHRGFRVVPLVLLAVIVLFFVFLAFFLVLRVARHAIAAVEHALADADEAPVAYP